MCRSEIRNQSEARPQEDECERSLIGESTKKVPLKGTYSKWCE